MTAALIAFAGDGYAFREGERAAVRPLLLATLDAAMRDARAERVERALAALAPSPSRLHATLIGRGERVSPLVAALVNGIAASATATIATPIVCAALAATESAEAPGATVLDAIVAGLEVALRVERALQGHRERGWDVRGTCGRLGAAIAAARAYGLQRVQTHNAFGLAATAAGGLRAAAGTMTEAYVIGSAAADGIEAALLARADFTAAPDALAGRRGLAALMADAIDLPLLVDGLGVRFVVRDDAGDAAPDVADALRDAVAALERAPSVAALVAATCPP
jgi:2-methylcitrate dehydratase PrpD